MQQLVLFYCEIRCYYLVRNAQSVQVDPEMEPGLRVTGQQFGSGSGRVTG